MAESHLCQQRQISSEFLTSLLWLQSNEFGYRWDSMTCAWPWISPKWRKMGFRMPQSSKHKIWSRNLAPMCMLGRSGVLSFLSIKRWRRQFTDIRLYFFKTTRLDTILAKIRLQRIRWQAGDSRQQAHLHPTNKDTKHQSGHHLWRNSRQPQLVTIPELYIPTSTIRRADMHIHIHIVPMLNCLLLVHLPRIASMIQIVSQIYWLLMEYPLVSTLSAVR